MGRREELNKSMDTLFPQSSSDVCRVCEEDVVDGRWNYCSERCREIAQAVQRMFIWDHVREQVLERDDYTCQECGLSKDRWWRAYHQVQELIKEQVPHPRDSEAEISWDEWRTRISDLEDVYDVEAPSGGGFHTDHIQRLADGGHPLDESNLQTLCKFCHTEKTAEENRKESAEQRPEIGLDEYL